MESAICLLFSTIDGSRSLTLDAEKPDLSGSLKTLCSFFSSTLFVKLANKRHFQSISPQIIRIFVVSFCNLAANFISCLNEAAL